MILWRIYYGDGSIFDNSMGLPEDAPGSNVQIVVDCDPDVGRHLLTSHTGFYWFENGRWFTCLDTLNAGFIQYLKRPGLKITKLGETMDSDEFRALYMKAAEDPDFPRKRGWKADEKPPWLTWE